MNNLYVILFILHIFSCKPEVNYMVCSPLVSGKLMSSNNLAFYLGSCCLLVKIIGGTDELSSE